MPTFNFTSNGKEEVRKKFFELLSKERKRNEKLMKKPHWMCWISGTNGLLKEPRVYEQAGWIRAA